jgi:acyl-CoA synthetase (AMP-forming)/AMP-acid ligase II/acyl carrier protein
MNHDTSLVTIAMQRAVALAEEPVYTFLHNGSEEERRLTYRQLDHAARTIAAELQQRGITPKSRVILLFAPGLGFIEAFLGTLYAGMIAVPVNPPGSGQTWENFASILANAEPAAILADSSKVNYLSRQCQVLGIAPPACPVIDIATIDSAQRSLYRKTPVANNDIAMLQYTSGTTSIPKGVMITHGNILHNQQRIEEQVTQGYKIGVSWLPVYHDMGLFGSILQSLYVGGHCIVMPPSSFLAKPARWLDAITRYRAEVSGFPNFALDLCVDTIDASQLSRFDLSCWKVAASGGEPVLSSSQRRFAAKFAACGFDAASFVPCYGLAESTLLVSAGKPNPHQPPTTVAVSQQQLNQGVITINSAPNDTREYVSCGAPVPSEVVIVDTATGELLPEDRLGEIWIRSESVASGYWSDAAKTAEVFNASVEGNCGYYRTGDSGFLHGGEIYIAGRIKEMIIIHGKNHYPGDIERTVQACHPALAYDCGSAVAIDRDGTERVIILQELKFAARNTTEGAAITEAIRAAVSAGHGIQLHAVVLLKPGGIFKTSSGKPKRSLCRDSWLAGVMEPLFEWKSAQLTALLSAQPVENTSLDQSEISEVTLPAILDRLVGWSAAKLGVPVSEIDPNASYTALGLDSVDIISLFGEVERWIGISINPDSLALWEVESLAEIAEMLHRVWQDPASFAKPDGHEETEGVI